jgi:multiple sugar transport system permease protein
METNIMKSNKSIKKIKKPMKDKNREILIAMVFIAPWVVGFLIFTLTPIISSLYYSLCDYNVVDPAKFVGLSNYAGLLRDDVFLKALSNTFYMVVVGVPIVTITAISISVLLNNKELRGSSAFRVIFFIPTLVPTVIACFLWIWMLQPDNGIINHLIGLFGIKGPGWIASPTWSKPAFILMMVWACGNSIILYLAGLQDIPGALYESASIDGANFFQKVKSITLPMLRPVILFNLVTSVIGVFQWFAEPFIITQGGPNNSTMFYSLYLYQNAFQFFKMGYASAMAWILLLIALVIILILFKVMKFSETDN